MSEPDGDRIKSDEKRDDRASDGRFLPGHALAGPGRPRGYDFAAIAEERVKRTGETIEEAVGELIDNLRAAARKPAFTAVAAKVLLDRLCGPVVARVAHGGDPDGPPIGVVAADGPPLPAARDFTRDMKKLAKLAGEVMGDGSSS